MKLYPKLLILPLNIGVNFDYAHPECNYKCKIFLDLWMKAICFKDVNEITLYCYRHIFVGVNTCPEY
ncbi:hypothetical protein Avbf_05132 [Armadillidium vulgare]|nr:hypothetical protein Avbf_05132 [Armadillidium vulgare]